jgi:hypothetical protein
VAANDRALSATVVVSSSGTDQGGDKAIDGIVEGFTVAGGNPYTEWASNWEGAGATLLLTWSSLQSVRSITLWDRPNLDDQVTGATLTFSDGTVYTIGALTNDGSGDTFTLPTTISTTSLLFTVTSVSSSTWNIGLSEIAVYPTAADIVARSVTKSGARWRSRVTTNSDLTTTAINKPSRNVMAESMPRSLRMQPVHRRRV